MGKTTRAFKMAVIIAAAAAVVSFGAARIILFSSPDAYGRGYGFHSWGMSRETNSRSHAGRWAGKWEMRSMTEAEREALYKDGKFMRPSFPQRSQMFGERFQSFRENNPAALVLFGIGNLAMLSLCILGLLWLNALAKKINTVCKGDGKKTAGAVKFLLLGIITFGIYNLLWLYMLGERLQDNAQRYNLSFKEGGAAVLLWFVPGIFIMVGPFIALYIIIKNTNALTAAYSKETA